MWGVHRQRKRCRRNGNVWIAERPDRPLAEKARISQGDHLE